MPFRFHRDSPPRPFATVQGKRRRAARPGDRLSPRIWSAAVLCTNNATCTKNRTAAHLIPAGSPREPSADLIPKAGICLQLFRRSHFAAVPCKSLGKHFGFSRRAGVMEVDVNDAFVAPPCLALPTPSNLF